jgi:hypothetical protein
VKSAITLSAESGWTVHSATARANRSEISRLDCQGEEAPAVRTVEDFAFDLGLSRGKGFAWIQYAHSAWYCVRAIARGCQSLVSYAVAYVPVCITEYDKFDHASQTTTGEGSDLLGWLIAMVGQASRAPPPVRPRRRDAGCLPNASCRGESVTSGA